jgi:hypothetical protein
VLRAILNQVSTRRERLEITTKIGCPVNCLKFCPQEVLIRKYKGERELTLENFKRALETVPKNVEIIFSGYCEPFANRKAIDMIEYAYYKGYSVSVLTTMYQATEEDTERLVKLKFHVFCLHLPDGDAMKIPLSPPYMANVFKVMQSVKNASFISMNKQFKTNNREVFVRGLQSKKKPIRFCQMHYLPDFVLLPNGDLQLCCMDFGLWHTVGNLFKQDYPTIKANYMRRKKNFALCTLCTQNISYLKMASEYVKKGYEQKIEPRL